MADKILGNNQVNIYGEVVSEFAFSHEVYGEGFYMVYLSVKRLSKCMTRFRSWYRSGLLT